MLLTSAFSLFIIINASISVDAVIDTIYDGNIQITALCSSEIEHFFTNFTQDSSDSNQIFDHEEWRASFLLQVTSLGIVRISCDDGDFFPQGERKPEVYNRRVGPFSPLIAKARHVSPDDVAITWHEPLE